MEPVVDATHADTLGAARTLGPICSAAAAAAAAATAAAGADTVAVSGTPAPARDKASWPVPIESSGGAPGPAAAGQLGPADPCGPGLSKAHLMPYAADADALASDCASAARSNLLGYGSSSYASSSTRAELGYPCVSVPSFASVQGQAQGRAKGQLQLLRPGPSPTRGHPPSLSLGPAAAVVVAAPPLSRLSRVASEGAPMERTAVRHSGAAAVAAGCNSGAQEQVRAAGATAAAAATCMGSASAGEWTSPFTSRQHPYVGQHCANGGSGGGGRPGPLPRGVALALAASEASAAPAGISSSSGGGREVSVQVRGATMRRRDKGSGYRSPTPGDPCASEKKPALLVTACPWPPATCTPCAPPRHVNAMLLLLDTCTPCPCACPPSRHAFLPVCLASGVALLPRPNGLVPTITRRHKAARCDTFGSTRAVRYDGTERQHQIAPETRPLTYHACNVQPSGVRARVLPSAVPVRTAHYRWRLFLSCVAGTAGSSAALATFALLGSSTALTRPTPQLSPLAAPDRTRTAAAAAAGPSGKPTEANGNGSNLGHGGSQSEADSAGDTRGSGSSNEPQRDVGVGAEAAGSRPPLPGRRRRSSTGSCAVLPAATAGTAEAEKRAAMAAVAVAGAGLWQDALWPQQAAGGLSRLTIALPAPFARSPGHERAGGAEGGTAGDVNSSSGSADVVAFLPPVVPAAVGELLGVAAIHGLGAGAHKQAAAVGVGALPHRQPSNQQQPGCDTDVAAPAAALHGPGAGAEAPAAEVTGVQQPSRVGGLLAAAAAAAATGGGAMSTLPAPVARRLRGAVRRNTSFNITADHGAPDTGKVAPLVANLQVGRGRVVA